MLVRRRPARHGGKPPAARLCHAAMSEVVTRGEFAARAGRSPSAVNRWVERGQLSGAALTADGRIVVDEAEAQLARSLNPWRGRPPGLTLADAGRCCASGG